MTANQDSITSTIDKAIHSEDEPLGKKVPGAPFAIVALSYLAALILGAAFISFLIWLI